MGLLGDQSQGGWYAGGAGAGCVQGRQRRRSDCEHA